MYLFSKTSGRTYVDITEAFAYLNKLDNFFVTLGTIRMFSFKAVAALSTLVTLPDLEWNYVFSVNFHKKLEIFTKSSRYLIFYYV